MKLTKFLGGSHGSGINFGAIKRSNSKLL